jgi:predicted transcriptional regulator
MKVLLEVPDHKADFVMDLLENYSFIKTTSLSVNKILTDEEKQAIDEGISSIDSGKSQTHEEFMAKTRNRYPHLFK